MIRTLCFGLLIATQLAASPRKISDFPAINQHRIAGASERCGTIALGSWLLWLGENGYPELLAVDHTIANNPFASATIPRSARNTLSRLDATLGGRQEIKLRRLIEGMIDYFHQQPTEALELTLRYFNLPNEIALRDLNGSGAAVVLLHGIYRTNATTGELMRVRGHYTCLIGQTKEELITNTFGQNFTFELAKIPMQRLQAKDRYRAKGLESLVYLHCPAANYPRYRLNVYAAQNGELAQVMKIRDGRSFAKPNEAILLEGALALWLERVAP